MRVIGILSGTSFDAVEALLANLELNGESLVVDLVAHRSVPYPEDISGGIAQVLPPARVGLAELTRLDADIGRFFGRVAASLAEDHGGAAVVCSHGQTVYHLVEGRTALGTMQLGEPAFIAEATGCAVVSDVRSADIALGGQGAPLASLLDVLLLGPSSARPRASLNLGGIANVTVVGSGAPYAYDIGPANALIDAAASFVSGGSLRYDKDGELAASGAADERLVAKLLDDPYFALAPPKSTGKELFNLDYLIRRLGPDKLSPGDLLASVTAASAECVAASLRPLGLSELFVAGGGVRNRTFMSELSDRLPAVPLRPVDELGVPAVAKEALVFCVIGVLTMHGLPSTIPSCTGASRPAVLGSITPGAAGRLDLPAPCACPPSRLVVRTALSGVEVTA